MAVNFSTNQEEITRAWREVVDAKDSPKWALFGYQGNTNIIKLTSTGSNGLSELVREFNNSLIQYAFCRVIDNDIDINKLILINWQGDSSPLSRKGLCASHVGDVTNYFKGCCQTITIRNDDEATVEYLMEQIAKTSSSRIRSLSGLSHQTTNSIIQKPDREASLQNSSNDVIGSNYKKVDISSDIASDRISFWKRQEEEEKERLLEEKKRAAEKQAQYERERKHDQETEAKKLAETIRERDRLIEATRKAERFDSLGSSSQPSSSISSNAMNSSENNEDDDRVGRRSEFIRLERNQETQALISKGLIKNKRAIFEQAASQQQQSQAPLTQSNLARRSSGAMITQRMNSLRSFENTSSPATSVASTNNSKSSTMSTKNIENLSNGFADKVKVNNNSDEGQPKSIEGIVTSKVETIKITNNDIEESKSSVVTQRPNGNREVENNEKTPSESISQNEAEVINNNNNNINNNNNNNFEKNNFEISQDKEGSIQKESPVKNSKIESGETDSTNGPAQISSTTNGQMGIKARALYDYQASDNTEISFDPNDLIGYIEKVDPGWWHGIVLTGAFKGQTGLFPSNYVQEL